MSSGLEVASSVEVSDELTINSNGSDEDGYRNAKEIEAEMKNGRGASADLMADACMAG